MVYRGIIGLNGAIKAMGARGAIRAIVAIGAIGVLQATGGLMGGYRGCRDKVGFRCYEGYSGFRDNRGCWGQ